MAHLGVACRVVPAADVAYARTRGIRFDVGILSDFILVATSGRLSACGHLSSPRHKGHETNFEHLLHSGSPFAAQIPRRAHTTDSNPHSAQVPSSTRRSRRLRHSCRSPASTCAPGR